MGIWSVYINSFLSINGGTDSFHRDATQILQPFPLALPNPPPLNQATITHRSLSVNF